MKYLSLVVMTSVVTGCSSFGSISDTTNLIDYSNYKSVKVLEVPADLDKPAFDSTYVTKASDEALADNSKAVDSSVPLVDGAMVVVPKAGSVVTKQGSDLVIKSTGGAKQTWASSTEALKAMGMTINKSDQAAGVMHIRDRAQISSPDSALGAFLNRTVGRLNAGEEYQFIMKADSVTFADKAGKKLPEAEAKALLTRYQKALTSE